MYSTVGRPRVLSEANVAAAQEWRRKKKSAVQLAKELGVHVGTLMDSVKRPDRPEGVRVRGKRRALTGASLAAAREWYRTRRTARELAQELGVTPRQFLNVAEQGRVFKGAPPEKRQVALQARRQVMEHLELHGPN